MRARGRLILFAGAVLLVGSAAAVVHVGRTAIDLQHAIEAAASTPSCGEGCRCGDITGAEKAASLLSAEIGPAIPTDDPVWGAAEAVPGIGANLSQRVGRRWRWNAWARTLRRLLATARKLADADAPAAIGVLREAAPDLAAQWRPRATTSPTILRGSNRSALIPQLSDGVAKMVDAIDRLKPLTEGADQLAGVLPAFLGANGGPPHPGHAPEPRRNSGPGAASREPSSSSTPATVVSLLVAQRDSSQFTSAAEPLVPVPRETRALGDGIRAVRAEHVDDRRLHRDRAARLSMVDPERDVGA
ncbi:hypothetical protein [Microbacterium sp. MM2322]|uniref:hypothetical protein n=1 Tax=Microbacterium sp. MM2322 TaxID=3157631 RepID=UPI0032D5893D